MDEFAVIDNDGKLWGNPAQTFTSADAAARVVDYIAERRREMEYAHDEAKRQWDELERAYELAVGRAHQVTPSNGQPTLMPASEADARAVIAYRRAEEALQTWAREKDRRFTVVHREVTSWEAVA